MYCCDLVVEDASVDVCLHRMVEEKCLHLENLYFASPV